MDTSKNTVVVGILMRGEEAPAVLDWVFTRDQDVERLGGLAARDRHETSLALLLAGLAVTAPLLPQLAGPGPAGSGFGVVGILGPGWAAGMLLALALAVLWLTFRRRAARCGGRYRAGFGAAAVAALILSLPPAFFVLFYAGPFAVFGPCLLMAGIWQRNRLLAWWAALTGTAGIAEGFFAIINRLPFGLWADWEHPAILLALGLATVIAGTITWMRENRNPGSGKPPANPARRQTVP